MKIEFGDFEFTECWDGVLYKKLSGYPEITFYRGSFLLCKHLEATLLIVAAGVILDSCDRRMMLTVTREMSQEKACIVQKFII